MTTPRMPLTLVNIGLSAFEYKHLTSLLSSNLLLTKLIDYNNECSLHSTIKFHGNLCYFFAAGGTNVLFDDMSIIKLGGDLDSRNEIINHFDGIIGGARFLYFLHYL